MKLNDVIRHLIRAFHKEDKILRVKRKNPELILRGGKPTAVIIDMDEYQEMLERLEDAEDLRVLDEMRRQPLKFKKLEDFLNEYTLSV